MEDCRGCAVGVVHRYPALPSAGGAGPMVKIHAQRLPQATACLQAAREGGAMAHTRGGAASASASGSAGWELKGKPQNAC